MKYVEGKLLYLVGNSVGLIDREGGVPEPEPDAKEAKETKEADENGFWNAAEFHPFQGPLDGCGICLAASIFTLTKRYSTVHLTTGLLGKH